MPSRRSRSWSFYEFFAGGGMARIGLGRHWHCAFANEWSEKKARSYRENFSSSSELVVGDVCALTTEQVPGQADLAWASFPCQDLSLAGNGLGLNGGRSGTFWGFWQLLTNLATEGRRPPIVVLENVEGLLTSNGGADFKGLCATLASSGFRFGFLQVDGILFVPQSRPRVFIVAIDSSVDVGAGLAGEIPNAAWHSPTLEAAVARLPRDVREKWLWWNLPTPGKRKVMLSHLIENVPAGVSWHSAAATERLLEMMSPVNRRKVAEVQKSKRWTVGTIYKRTRIEQGQKFQRAEVRFDDVSGCLRTPAGGSSRQIILVVEGRKVRSRLLSAREACRLMGLPESYRIPKSYNEAYHLFGDGLVAPAVTHLAKFLLEPLAAGARGRIVPIAPFQSNVRAG
jgi:DNA (cytosine-5)-methyltransferase 1